MKKYMLKKASKTGSGFQNSNEHTSCSTSNTISYYLSEAASYIDYR